MHTAPASPRQAPSAGQRSTAGLGTREPDPGEMGSVPGAGLSFSFSFPFPTEQTDHTQLGAGKAWAVRTEPGFSTWLILAANGSVYLGSERSSLHPRARRWRRPGSEGGGPGGGPTGVGGSGTSRSPAAGGRSSLVGSERCPGERESAAMELAGALQLGELATAFARVPVFPLFDLGYFVVSILYLKYEPGAVEMSRQSPVASWLCAMLHCFGSYLLADTLLGEAPIDFFSNNPSVLLATAVWYLIFFCPMNLFYKSVSFLPVKLIFVAMKEVVRVRKIAAGVYHAHHHYHHGWFIMVVTGWVKGSGIALVSNFEQLLRGVWKPETNEVLHMSFPTKASLYGAILFTLQQTHWLPISKANLIFFFTMFMIVCKVFMTATHSHASPFTPVEGFICPVLFGSVYSGHNNHPHDHHESSHDTSPPPASAKSKEELNEGTRKRKAKKAE